MDVNFSLVVGAEARSSFIQGDMEEDACSYSAGCWENEVISEREHSAVKSSITATALFTVIIFSNANTTFKSSSFGTPFTVVVWLIFLSRLRKGESHALCLFPFLWRCCSSRNRASCRVTWRAFLTEQSVLSSELLLLLLIRGKWPMCSTEGVLEPRQGGDLQSLAVEWCCSVVLSCSMLRIHKKYSSALDLILLLFFEVEKCRLCQISGMEKA